MVATVGPQQGPAFFVLRTSNIVTFLTKFGAGRQQEYASRFAPNRLIHFFATSFFRPGVSLRPCVIILPEYDTKHDAASEWILENVGNCFM